MSIQRKSDAPLQSVMKHEGLNVLSIYKSVQKLRLFASDLRNEGKGAWFQVDYVPKALKFFKCASRRDIAIVAHVVFSQWCPVRPLVAVHVSRKAVMAKVRERDTVESVSHIFKQLLEAWMKVWVMARSRKKCLEQGSKLLDFLQQFQR